MRLSSAVLAGLATLPFVACELRLAPSCYFRVAPGNSKIVFIFALDEWAKGEKEAMAKILKKQCGVTLSESIVLSEDHDGELLGRGFVSQAPFVDGVEDCLVDAIADPMKGEQLFGWVKCLEAHRLLNYHQYKILADYLKGYIQLYVTDSSIS